MHIKKLVILLLLIILTSNIFALSMINHTSIEDTRYVDKHFNTAENTDFIEPTNISLSIIGKGDELYSWFGHSALGIKNKNEDIIYDYGVFNFSDDFYLNFALGRLWFRLVVGDRSFRYMLADYNKRSVTKLEFNFTEQQTKKIVNFLNNNVEEENAIYLYHHYYDNCATRPRDIINAALDNEFKLWAKEQKSDATIRNLTIRYMGYNFPVIWTLNYLQGPLIDKSISLWEAMFLPKELEKALIEYNRTLNEPLINNIEHIRYEADTNVRVPPRDNNFNLVPISLAFGLAIALIIYLLIKVSLNANNKFIRISCRLIVSLVLFALFTFLTIVSIVLAFMMFFSNHDVTYYNINLSFINPILIVFAFSSFAFIFGNNRNLNRIQRFSKVYSIVTIIALSLPAIAPSIFYQDNLPIILTILPIYITLGFSNILKEEDIPKSIIQISKMKKEAESASYSINKISVENSIDSDYLEPFKP